MKITNSLSHCAARLTLSRGTESTEAGPQAQASGCFWDRDGTLVLVTNWHNFTGWDPVNDCSMSDMCLTPNVVFVSLAYRVETAPAEAIHWRELSVDLLDQDGRPRWLEHPVHGRKVDVVALELGKIGEAKLWTEPVNTYSHFVDFEPAAGDDAMVIGFPLGISGGFRFPIWKRASIASEPDIDLDELPKLLVDTATRKGMSGSPVIAVRRGLTRPRGSEGTPLSGNEVIGTSETFLGVYSGRVGSDALGAQLGTVWKAEAVREVVETGVLGRHAHE